MAIAEVVEHLEARERRKGHLARAASRLVRKKVAMASLVTLIVVYSAGIFAPLVAPFDYTDQNY